MDSNSCIIISPEIAQHPKIQSMRDYLKNWEFIIDHDFGSYKAESQNKEFINQNHDQPQKWDLYQYKMYVDKEFKILVIDSENRKLKIDFNDPKSDHQRKILLGKNELIAKALGSQKGTKKILDLSAGMGVDAFFMARLGFDVTAVERNPLLYTLLSNARDFLNEEMKSRIQFLLNDSTHVSRDLKFLEAFDAIYFDPMYPHKTKSALPKQEMLVFRNLVGNDDDASLVLKNILDSGVKRVVVKRPLKAEELAPGVVHRFKGKTVRYDLYINSLKGLEV